MEDWTKKRKEWSDARDKLGLKKGAVKGVSLGDELDKVGKAQGSYKSLAAALGKLQGVVAKYVAGLPKGSEKVKAWIKTNLEGKAEADLKSIAADRKSLAWIRAELIDDLVANILGAHPDSGSLRNINALMQKKPELSWEAAAKAIGIFTIPGKVVAINAKRVGELSKISFSQLAGRDAAYKAISGYLAPLRSDVVFYGKWAAAKTSDEYASFMKASGQRQTSSESFDAMKKAVVLLEG